MRGPVPERSAPFDDRGFLLLPDLLAELIAAAEAEAVEVEEAAREVDRFTTAVRAMRDEGGK